MNVSYSLDSYASICCNLLHIKYTTLNRKMKNEHYTLDKPTSYLETKNWFFKMDYLNNLS